MTDTRTLGIKAQLQDLEDLPFMDAAEQAEHAKLLADLQAAEHRCELDSPMCHGDCDGYYREAHIDGEDGIIECRCPGHVALWWQRQAAAA